MSIDPVTARWANALWNVASREGALASVMQDVDRLAAVATRAEVRAALVDPRRSRAERAALFQSTLATAHALTRNFASLLLERGREEVLVGIGAAFKRRRLAEANQIEGVVESARPLARPEIDALAKAYGAVLGKELQLENRIVPSLVGGARVFAGNRMIDQSVQGRLDALRRKLLDARLPTAATN